MPPRAQGSKRIMVVESPSKAPKIEKLLGGGWKVLATKGHICVIDDGLKGVGALRTEGNIRFKTVNHKFVRDLKAAMREAGTRVVHIGTDDDREGEAIGFHVCRVAGLDPHAMPRLRFNAIEARALRAAVENPVRIDMHLVEAQMCRQAIDLILGYTASPLLWKAIGGRQSLSAGRCQTPALTLVCEQHKAAQDATEGLVWATETVVPGCAVVFRGAAGQRTADKDTAEEQLTTFQNGVATVGSLVDTTRTLAPPKPLTTARMQQQCGMGTKRCMSAAQKLYEAGAITYHRTDSYGYNPTFARALTEHIQREHGADMVGKIPIVGGGAHESIRATDVGKTGLGKTMDERRLYKFIRQRTVASGMVAATIRVVSRTLTAARDGVPTLTAQAMRELMVRPGWTEAEQGGPPTTPESKAQFVALERFPVGPVSPEHTTAIPMIVGTKAPLTEAKLVKTLETVGVGRPSTFASIVNKLFERRYAVVQDIKSSRTMTEEGVKRGHGPVDWQPKELEHGGAKARLAPTPLGIRVEETCKRVFGDALAVSATAAMEEQLDRIAKGDGAWVESALEYWAGVQAQADAGKALVKREREESKRNAATVGVDGSASIGSTSAPLAEPGIAELEGHPIVLRHGRYGPYLAWNGVNVKIKGRKMPNGGQAIGMVQAHLAVQAQIRDLGNGVTVRPGKNGTKYAMVRKGKKAEFVGLKDCPIGLDDGNAVELREWIMSQL
jgi:DNA topoisomerase-1